MSWILIFRKFPLFLPYFLHTFKRDLIERILIIRYIYICTYIGISEKLICRRQREFFESRRIEEREFSVGKLRKDRATEVFEYFRLSDTLRATVHLDRHPRTWISTENFSHKSQVEGGLAPIRDRLRIILHPLTQSDIKYIRSINKVASYLFFLRFNPVLE